MPTVLESTVEFQLDAVVLWAVKQDPGMDEAIAKEDGRVMSIDEEEHTQDDKGRRYVKRVTNMRILKNPLPRWIQRVLGLGSLDFKVRGEWWPDVCSEAQPYTFEVYSTHKSTAGKFTIKGVQYIEPLEGSVCRIHSRVLISVSVAAVGGIVENVLKEKMQKSYSGFPALLKAYIDSNGMPDMDSIRGRATLADKARQTDTGFLHERNVAPCSKGRLSCLQLVSASTTGKTRVARDEAEAEELLYRLPCWRRACLKVLACLYRAPSEVMPQECVEVESVRIV